MFDHPESGDDGAQATEWHGAPDPPRTLSDAGLVDRGVPDEDRRSVHACLTEAGRSMLNRSRRRRAVRLEHDLASLSETDRAPITAAISALERLVGVPLSGPTTSGCNLAPLHVR